MCEYPVLIRIKVYAMSKTGAGGLFVIMHVFAVRVGGLNVFLRLGLNIFLRTDSCLSVAH